MNSDHLEVDALFTTNGKDVWKLKSYFDGPSCILRNLETGKEEEFGMGGLTADSFKPLKMEA